MRKNTTLLAVSGVLALGGALAVATASQVLAETSAASSPGVAVYAGKCAACHGVEPSGGEHAPPLAGADFWSKWEGQPARALYSRIISTMPMDAPGTLSEAETLALVDYFVRLNTGTELVATVKTANELNALTMPAAK
ncbi:c-type cytochrome [Phenylobacterium sp.]|jgi:mono/diheme cytochrome c family protein|uniref:c-type cytochrome n=1 Tax=Phenylobacterium sp. TaxID=1871053 RepID=UPI003783ACDA